MRPFRQGKNPTTDWKVVDELLEIVGKLKQQLSNPIERLVKKTEYKTQKNLKS